MTDDGRQLLAKAQDLAPSITRRSAEIEAGRELPTDLLNDLISAGFFRMGVPRSHGGLEIDLPNTLAIFETLAQADGSTAWNVMIASEIALLLTRLPRARFDALYADGPDVITAGSIAPRGEFKLVPDGYEVNGRWSFASGCRHCH